MEWWRQWSCTQKRARKSEESLFDWDANTLMCGIDSDDSEDPTAMTTTKSGRASGSGKRTVSAGGKTSPSTKNARIGEKGEKKVDVAAEIRTCKKIAFDVGEAMQQLGEEKFLMKFGRKVLERLMERVAAKAPRIKDDGEDSQVVVLKVSPTTCMQVMRDAERVSDNLHA